MQVLEARQNFVILWKYWQWKFGLFSLSSAFLLNIKLETLLLRHSSRSTWPAAAAAARHFMQMMQTTRELPRQPQAFGLPQPIRGWIPSTNMQIPPPPINLRGQHPPLKEVFWPRLLLQTWRRRYRPLRLPRLAFKQWPLPQQQRVMEERRKVLETVRIPRTAQKRCNHTIPLTIKLA